jgi:translation initiation factor 5
MFSKFFLIFSFILDPTKFCGHELGSQSKFDPSEGKAIVNGSHTQQDLQLLIDKFIDKFVLCEQCKLPEIDLLLKKNRVGYRCNACGNQGQVDNRHKLATFIMKNPPDGGDSTLGTQTK